MDLTNEHKEPEKHVPSPPSKKVKNEEFSDYRQFMVPLVPFIRFGLMSPSFISHVAPTQLLEAPKLLSLFQFLTHPEIPPQTIVNEVGSLERRNAQKFVFSKFIDRFNQFWINDVHIGKRRWTIG